MIEVRVGDLVSYYLDGWRAGHLDSVKGAYSFVRPIPARGGPQIRLVKVLTADLTMNLRSIR